MTEQHDEMGSFLKDSTPTCPPPGKVVASAGGHVAG